MHAEYFELGGFVQSEKVRRGMIVGCKEESLYRDSQLYARLKKV